MNAKIMVGLIGSMCIVPSVAGLPSAQAAALTPITVTCSGGSTGVLQFTTRVYGAAANDTIVVTNNAGINITFSVIAGTGYTLTPSGITPNGSSTTITVGSSSTGTIRLTAAAGGNCDSRTQLLEISYSAAPAPAPSPSTPTTTNAAPTPIIQQFGKPATGTCDAAQPEMLNIGGSGSGGWSESWAEWMNAGLGGAVCTRTLVYSNDLGHWVVS